MRKEKTLSLILASAMVFGNLSSFILRPGMAFASDNFINNEDTKSIQDETNKNKGINAPGILLSPVYASEENPESALVNNDIETRFSLDNTGDYDYNSNKYKKTTEWTLTIKNQSDKDIYLGELISKANSRNFTYKRITFDRSGLSKPYNTKQANYILSSYSVTYNKKITYNIIYDDVPTNKAKPINIEMKFNKLIRIRPQESLKIKFNTEIFSEDYSNPFNPIQWKAKDKLEDGDIKTLLNNDISLGFNGKFYLDPDRKQPIVSNKLQDYSQASFRINADIGSINFPNGVETFLKKADEEGFNKVDEIPSLNTDDTLKFVLPIKINSNSDKYKEFLEESNNKQYLVNPRFLINQGDDESLDQKFYIEHNKETYELSSQPTDDGEFTEIDFGNNLPDFMEEFNLVYEVKFTNSDRTHGLNKNIKLIYDNSDFIKVDKGIDSLNVDLKADYQDAHKDYLVNFETNGHGILDSQTIAENGKATEPTRPEASGYSFEGWYADESFTEKFDFNTLITKNTTLYAKWAKLMKISYRFESKNKGESLPDEITALLEKLSPVEDRVGEKIKAPQNIFEDVKVNNGIWSFKGWDKGEIILSEDGDNVFVGKWVFIENPKENPKADSTKENPSKNQKDSHNNQNNPYIKPGEGTEKEPDNKENADQVREKENDPEEEFDLNRSKEAENQSSADIENQDKKSSLDDEDKSNVDASSKENLTDFSGADEKSSQSDNKNLKETKADLKVVGTSGTSSKKEANDVKKLDKSQFNKAHKDQKLIGEAEISVKETSKIADSLPNKGKKRMKSATNPKTGIAGMGFVSSILALASVGFYFSKKFKKD